MLSDLVTVIEASLVIVYITVAVLAIIAGFVVPVFILNEFDSRWRYILAPLSFIVILGGTFVVGDLIWHAAVGNEPAHGSCQYYHYGYKGSTVCDQFYPLPQLDR